MPLKLLLQSALIASSACSYSVHSFSLIRSTTILNTTTNRRSIPTSISAQRSSYSFLHTQSNTKSNTKRNMSSNNSDNSDNSNNNNNKSHYPDLLVYDMDACLWDKEMYEMTAMPSTTVMGDLNGRGEGVIGVMSGRQKISLHKGSLLSLQEHWDQKYPSMKIAMASSADTPFAEKVGRASLKLLEVIPGITVWDVLMRDWDNQDVNQIGRQPPLSSNKSMTHFPFLKQRTGIRYDKMLFFDDCNWGDHCGMVERNCREEDNGIGPVTVRTPNGLGEREFRSGMEAYARRSAN